MSSSCGNKCAGRLTLEDYSADSTHFCADKCTFDLHFAIVVVVAAAPVVGVGCRQVRRLILIIIIMTAIAAVVAFQDETSAARSSLGLPSFDIAPRISQSTSFLERFSVREWIVRRPIHVFADRNPTWTELFRCPRTNSNVLILGRIVLRCHKSDLVFYFHVEAAR